MFTYVAPADDGKSSYIYVLGNPVVWWGTLLGAAVVVIGWSLRRELFRPWRWPLGLLAFAWAVDYLPFGPARDLPKGQPATSVAVRFSPAHTTN